MVNHVAIGESIEGLKLPRKEGLSLRNYMAKFVNSKIATGNHTVSSQHLLNELLDKVKGEYNSGEAPWASRVLDQVTRDQDKARKHLDNILNAQIKRRRYYPDEGSAFRASKSHATSEGPEDHSDSDSPYRPSPEDFQRYVPGHTYETRAGQQFGASAPDPRVSDATNPNTINENAQSSSAPERPQGSRSGPIASENGTLDASGDKPHDGRTASPPVTKSSGLQPEGNAPLLHTYSYFSHNFEIDDLTQAPRIVQTMITSHEILAAELKQKIGTLKPHQVNEREECFAVEEFSARLQAMVVAHFRRQTMKHTHVVL